MIILCSLVLFRHAFIIFGASSTNVSITKTPTLLDGEASMHSHRTVLTLQQAIIFSHLKEDVAYFLKLPIKHQTAKLSFVQEDEEDIFNPFKSRIFLCPSSGVS